MRKNGIIGYAVATLLSLVAISSSLSAVKAPDERRSKIDLVGELLNRVPVALDEKTMAEIGNPFVANRKAEEVGLAEVTPDAETPTLSDADLLTFLAQQINPTGIVAIGGENYLMMREKRLRAGDVLSVMYEDVEYSVSITGVLRNAYILRLGDAELEIKRK